jgi:hypothetical protein
MLHARRAFLLAVVPTTAELAETLIETTCCLCAGFHLEGAPDTLFLNDSLSEDGAQEYAVLRCLDGTWYQVESITFGWIDSLDRAIGLIRQATTGAFDADARRWTAFEPRFHEPGEPCLYCC